MKRTRNPADAITLLLNRCHARLQSHHYDAALADATAVIEISQNNAPEKALFRAARALYSLQRWEACLDHLKWLKELNPTNKAAQQDITRCKRRLREKGGDYDVASMLEEAIAKSQSPDMDRANYIGPIAVRDCAIKTHGRGLFTTKAVQAGELLLCEKAFAAVFKPMSERQEKSMEETTADFSLVMRQRLVDKTLAKLQNNTSLVKKFQDLYPGPDWKDEIDKETELPVVDE